MNYNQKKQLVERIFELVINGKEEQAISIIEKKSTIRKLFILTISGLVYFGPIYYLLFIVDSNFGTLIAFMYMFFGVGFSGFVFMYLDGQDEK